MVKTVALLGSTGTITGVERGAVVYNGFAEPTFTLIVTIVPAVSRTVMIAAPVETAVIFRVVLEMGAVATLLSLLLGVRLEENQTVVQVYPVYVKNRDPRVNYQPKVLRGAGAERIGGARIIFQNRLDYMRGLLAAGAACRAG